MNSRMGVYRYNAQRRNIDFHLTLDEFQTLIEANCFYCGQPPNQYTEGYPFPYNGVDRKNNEPWYDNDNSLSCCKTCNIAKGEMSFVAFLQWRDRMVVYVLGQCT